MNVLKRDVKQIAWKERNRLLVLRNGCSASTGRSESMAQQDEESSDHLKNVSIAVTSGDFHLQFPDCHAVNSLAGNLRIGLVLACAILY